MGLRDRIATARNGKPPSSGDVPRPTQPWTIKPNGLLPEAESITAADLLALEFDPPKFVVDQLLSEGLTVLGGKPKHGKSWLALLIGWAVAAGCEVDGRASWQGEVLYLALEDTRRRLQGRIAKLRDALGWVVPETLTLRTSSPRAGDGGLYQVAEWLQARPKVARLVIVDTLGKFRTPPKGAGGSSYSEDYEAVGGLKEMLDHFGCAGLLIHHTRKLRSEDPFDELSGTLAITGAADSIWMLDTTQKGADAKLYLTGRDQADATVPLSFEKDSGRWRFGQTREGIDTAGREASPAVGKLEQCKQWLKDFLKEYAYPSEEIKTAGIAAGFSPSTISDAKTAMGSKGTREVVHANFGNGWWSGIGPSQDWKRRPVEVPQ